MLSLIVFGIAAAALHHGAPVIFSIALTALLASLFPAVIVLVVVAAVAVWAFRHFSNWR